MNNQSQVVKKIEGLHELIVDDTKLRALVDKIRECKASYELALSRLTILRGQTQEQNDRCFAIHNELDKARQELMGYAERITA